MKKLFFLLFALGACYGLQAQKAWLEALDGGDFDPEDSVKIYIDINQCDCQRLLGNTSGVYLWTWQPGEPAIGNGMWTASNADMEMTHEGGDIWSYKLVPTTFYGVDAAAVYANDFSMLAKLFDGTGLGGGGCDEDKTEDLQITVDAPVVGLRLVYSFPDVAVPDSILSSSSDVFTLFYENSIEAKATMQNLGDEVYIYARVYGLDGVRYNYTSLNQVGNTPELKMTQGENGQYTWSIIPDKFFESTLLGSGTTIDYLEVEILKVPFSNTDDKVDGKFVFGFMCD